MKPDEIVQLPKIEACLKDIKAWMTNNFLLFNSDKSEVMLPGPKQLRMTLSSHLPTLNGISFTSNTSTKNLYVIINQDLLLDSHIKQISNTYFFHLCNIAKIRKNSIPQRCRKKPNPTLLLHRDYTIAILFCLAVATTQKRASNFPS